MCLEIIYLIYICKKLASSNVQWLICYKTKPNQLPTVKKTKAFIKENHFAVGHDREDIKITIGIDGERESQVNLCCQHNFMMTKLYSKSGG